jgi:hypothetical protein
VEDLPIYASVVASTITTLLALLGAVWWLARKLSLLEQIPDLSHKVERLEREVQEAIGVKRHMNDMMTRLSTLEHIIAGMSR